MKNIHASFLKGFRFSVALFISLGLLLGSLSAMAETAAELDQDVDSAYNKLISSSPAAKQIASVSKAVLVFPNIVKGGLIIGGQYGKGALRVKNKTTGFYNTAAASFGLQAGAQSFGYAMFFMTDAALKYLDASDGWEVGVGPTVTVVDEGVARSLSTSTAKEDVYVFFFDQKGLMLSLSIEGSKITKINMDK